VEQLRRDTGCSRKEQRDPRHAGGTRAARFFTAQHTKIEKKYTKRSPNGHKNNNIFPCETLQNLPKLGLFGLKLVYHLAALRRTLAAAARDREKGYSSGFNTINKRIAQLIRDRGKKTGAPSPVVAQVGSGVRGSSGLFILSSLSPAASLGP
jgi:hypothetical protein